MWIRLIIGCALASMSWSRATDGHPPHHHEAAPANTASDAPETGVLRFRVLGEEGGPVPARLTFIGPHGSEPDLFPNTQAAPDRLAVRKNVVYTLHGEGAITVPAGEYTLYASRGLEYSIAKEDMRIADGDEVTWTATLRREVDTSGWVSGDFHLHTLTYSGHGDSNLNERIISIIGEGVEFAVATDHNHNTDYGPAVEHLHAHDHLTHVTGNEVSAPLGHLNAFPLEPDRPVPPTHARDANALFKFIRDEPNRYGIRPIIQINHPRWEGIDYFTTNGLDPVTGESEARTWSDDFDSVEIFNENEGWGYFDAEVAEINTRSGLHSVLEDWFNLLNRGHRAAAVGNSDSHTVHYDMAGYPRNFLVSPTDDPSSIDLRDVAESIRERRVFTTCGPFVEMSVNGTPMGGMARASDGEARVRVRIQAASWIDCDRVKVVVNGDVTEVVSVPQTREPVRFDETITVSNLDNDSWVSLLVEGDDSLAPIVGDQGRPILPLAVTNPVWLDGDGDGVWTSPRDWARVHALKHESMNEIEGCCLSAALPKERGLLALAAAEQARPFAAELIASLLPDDDRRARLMALRAAELLADASLRQPLLAAWERDGMDGYERVVMIKAMAATGAGSLDDRMMEALERDGSAVARHGRELGDEMPGTSVRDWLVAAFFPSEGSDSLRRPLPPEDDFRPDASFSGKRGEPVTWQRMHADARGYLDARRIDERPEVNENSIWYALTWLRSPDDRRALVAFGTDDGAKLWVNDDLVHEDYTHHGASPMQTVRRVNLRKGWNRVLFKIQNGGGDTGVYLRPLDDEVTAGLPTAEVATHPED